AYAETPPLLTTLATGILWAGIGQMLVFNLDVISMPKAMEGFAQLGRGSLFGLPAPRILYGVVAVGTHLFLTRMTAGRFVYALGEKYATARLSGVPVRFNILLQYTVVALIAAFAGLVMAGSVDSMNARL